MPNQLLTSAEITTALKSKFEKVSKGLSKKQKKELLEMWQTFWMWS